jgi:IclR family KDG regulon transcriptional repressor
MKSSKGKQYSIIHSLDKGLYLLEILEQAGQPMNLQELWLKLKWDKATIYRLLTTLEKRGYIHRDPETREYTLGIKIYALYDSLIRNLDLQRICKPVLGILVKNTGQTAHLAVAVGHSIVFIDRQQGSERLSVNTQIGATEPLYCTALGKAFLAFVDKDQITDILPDPLIPYTPATITNRKKLEKELLRIKNNGYAVDNEEYIEGVRCIASSILNQYGSPVAMMGISGHTSRISQRNILEYGKLVRRLSLEVSRKFGYGIGGAFDHDISTYIESMTESSQT